MRGDRLIDTAEIDGPAVAGVEAKGAAPAARVDAVDVVLPAQRIVDIAAVAEHVTDQAQRVAAFPYRQIGDDAQVAAGVAVLGDRGPGNRLQFHRVGVRGLRHDADDADRKSTRLNSSHYCASSMPSS